MEASCISFQVKWGPDEKEQILQALRVVSGTCAVCVCVCVRVCGRVCVDVCVGCRCLSPSLT